MIVAVLTAVIKADDAVAAEVTTADMLTETRIEVIITVADPDPPEMTATTDQARVVKMTIGEVAIVARLAQARILRPRNLNHNLLRMNATGEPSLFNSSQPGFGLKSSYSSSRRWAPSRKLKSSKIVSVVVPKGRSSHVNEPSAY